MFAKARVRLLADRWTAYSRIVRFVGVDFTGADFALQVRTSRDQVPAPSALANLSKVTTVGAEGVRFVGVTTADGVPTSELHIVIAKATMAAMDVAADSGLAGSDGTAFYDLVIAPTNAAAFVAMAGEFVIEAGSTQSALTGGTGPGGITVIEIADNGVTVVLSGAQLAGQFAGEAKAARDDAADHASTASDAATTAVNAPGTSGTSTTSLTIGTGSHTFTTQTGKAWVVGQPVTIANTAAPATNYMDGTITAYNSSTGAMTVSVPAGATAGSGTYTAWTISLAGRRGTDGAAISQIVPGETLRDDVKRIMRTNNSRASRARVVWIMDDGYRNNFTVMAPILQQRGQVACIAPEVERIGATYPLTDPTRGLINHPVVTAADLRELIDRGWEVLNHMREPTPGSTLAQHISSYQAENVLLRQLLTGERVATGTVGVTNSGTITHSAYGSYAVQGGIYRGGVNNPTSDNASRYVFDRGVRDVPGADADQPLLFNFEGAKPTILTGYSIDITSGRTLSDILQMIDGLASTDATLIIYGHLTPPDGQETATPPSLNASAVDAISKALYDNGIQTVTWSQAFPGNLINDPRFENSRATFLAQSGDAAGFSTSPTYVGETRNVVLTTTAFRSGVTQTSARWKFAVQPFHLYRVRLGYVIDTDLTLNGGTGNRNHGLGMNLSTGQIGGAASSAGTADDWTMNGAFTLTASTTSTTSLAVGTGSRSPTVGTGLNFYQGQPIRCFRTSAPTTFMVGTVDSYNSATGAMAFTATDFSGTGSHTDWTIEAYRLPFRSTGGAVFYHEAMLASMDGWDATLFVGLVQCTGTVRIVHVSVENMGDFSRLGLTFPTWFNTTISRNITLPGLNQTGNRRRRWRGELTLPAAAPTYTTVNYAEVDSVVISSPTTGQTAYVLGLGAGAFANQGGMIATWNGSAWTFAAPSDRSYIRCNGTSQGIGGGRRWFHRFRSNTAGAVNVEVFSDEPFRDGHVVINGNVARISSQTGGRSDACILHAFPAWENLAGN